MANENAFWTHEDEVALIYYLLDHSSAAGDGKSFKNTMWKGASEKMPVIMKGGPKTPASCKYKYGNVCTPLSMSLSVADIYDSFEKSTVSLGPFRESQGGPGITRRVLLLTKPLLTVGMHM